MEEKKQINEQDQNNEKIKYPCSECERNETCGSTSCKEWKAWLSQEWNEIRKIFLD